MSLYNTVARVKCRYARVFSTQAQLYPKAAPRSLLWGGRETAPSTSLVRLLAGRLGTVEFLSLCHPGCLMGLEVTEVTRETDWGSHGAFEGLCWEMPAASHLFPSAPLLAPLLLLKGLEGRERTHSGLLAAVTRWSCRPLSFGFAVCDWVSSLMGERWPGGASPGSGKASPLPPAQVLYCVRGTGEKRVSGNGESTPLDGELEILNICMLVAARRNERREGRKRLAEEGSNMWRARLFKSYFPVKYRTKPKSRPLTSQSNYRHAVLSSWKGYALKWKWLHPDVEFSVCNSTSYVSAS